LHPGDANVHRACRPSAFPRLYLSCMWLCTPAEVLITPTTFRGSCAKSSTQRRQQLFTGCGDVGFDPSSFVDHLRTTVPATPSSDSKSRRQERWTWIEVGIVAAGPSHPQPPGNFGRSLAPPALDWAGSFCGASLALAAPTNFQPRSTTATTCSFATRVSGAKRRK
jgi:hypothetical protein